jgi:hypothetical protein
VLHSDALDLSAHVPAAVDQVPQRGLSIARQRRQPHKGAVNSPRRVLTFQEGS